MDQFCPQSRRSTIIFGLFETSSSHCHADELLALDRPAAAESVSDRGAVDAVDVPGAADDAVAARATATAGGHVARMVFRAYLVLVLKRCHTLLIYSAHFRKFLQLDAIQSPIGD